ncbi:GntR family transcriptional regulator [Telmatospirillum sp. J64-1]|uniref:GntR family transcriptional regulator n=1 Tax=Telmatospirillum sp. J64-1 TaxID=2502183 RepID=UPI001C8F51D1|nr:GntR family transcriptional regulator [Telmatospirillum sp. J64-1]
MFETLKRDIMLGELEPGEALTELDLAARFSCSQGRVREALLRLQDEGLVVRQGRRGTHVSTCTADEAVEMFRLRHMMECRAIRRTVKSPSRRLNDDLAALVRAMEEAAEANDEYLLAEIDRDFHRRLFSDANLPALQPILHRCLVHNHRFKIAQSDEVRDLMMTAKRHWPIVEAVARRDGDEAVRLLGHHIATIVDVGDDIFADSGILP